MLRTIWRRNASPTTSIVTMRPLPADPHPVKGPDRLSILVHRRPRSHADRPGPVRPGPSPRHPAPPDTRARSAPAAGCEVRSRSSTGTPVAAPRGAAGSRLAPATGCPIATSGGSTARIARPARPPRACPVQVNAITCPLRMDPGIRPARAVDPDPPSRRRCGVSAVSSSPCTVRRPGWTWKPAKSVPSYSTRAA